MVISTAISKNKCSIRLTDERWLHIISSHPEIKPTDFTIILEAVEKPDVILKGDRGEVLAVISIPRKKHWIVVVYREELKRKHGFIITAYITTDARWLFKRKTIWSKN
jgi:hypothetical protein